MKRFGLAGIALALAIVGTATLAEAPKLAHPGGTPIDAANPGVDAMFARPYIDKDEWRDAPVRHRYVHGGFTGTDTRFSYYLPPREQYEGRFFQHITPVPDSENLAQVPGIAREADKIAFSAASGAIFVESNGGGGVISRMPGEGPDPAIGGYRANAAVARYVRVVAEQMYGAHRTYGYAYGGSGGAFRTLGGVENTRGVWDGSVPYVAGSSMAIPNMFSVRMHAMRLLADKFDGIVDALEPGGSGDPYAGLNAEQAAALREVTAMGFPPLAWFGHRTMGVHGFTVLYPGMMLADPGYFTDFWTKPGYLGFDHPESFAGARLQFSSAIGAALDPDQAQAAGLGVQRIAGTARGAADTAWEAQVRDGSQRPVAYRLTGTPPSIPFLGGDLFILTGAAAGKRIGIREIKGDSVILGFPDLPVMARIRPGDEVRIDNSNFLAAQTFHRHQLPGPEFKVWDQFRGADGKPLYPQRPRLLGPAFTANASGTVPNGSFGGKMIMVESLWDREALPWSADWYRALAAGRPGGKAENDYRLWYTDRALHGDDLRQEDETRTVTYLPVLQQALRDVADWAERGIEPPASTRYKIVDGQVQVPARAQDRMGIQPLVSLKANGGKRADVRAGQTVRFVGTIEAPRGTGTIVAAEWDFGGKDRYPLASPVKANTGRISITASHAFSQPGTYFVALRGQSQRSDAAGTPFARLRNLDRVRVVVR